MSDNLSYQFNGSNPIYYSSGYTDQLSNTEVGGTVILGYSVASKYGTVSSGKVSSASAYTSCTFNGNGIVSSATLLNGGQMYVHAGTVDKLKVEAGAIVTVYQPVTAVENFHKWATPASATYDLAPVVRNVSCYGDFVLAQSATATNITAIGALAEITVKNQAVLTTAAANDKAVLNIEAGGVVNGLSANTLATVNVAQGAVANDVKISGGAVLNVTGTANGTIGYDGYAAVSGNFTSGAITNGGSAHVSNGGFIGGKISGEQVMINGGVVEILKGGTAGNLAVDNGGKLTFTDGAILNGTISLNGADNSLLQFGKPEDDSFFFNGYIMLDISGAEGNYGINAIESLNKYVDGSLYITVSNDQDSGTYILSEGVGNDSLWYGIGVFSSDRSYASDVSGAGISIGDIRVFDGREYFLENVDGALTLTITEAAPRVNVSLNKGDGFRYQDNRFIHAGNNTAYLAYCNESGLFGVNSGLVASSYKLGEPGTIVLGGIASDFKLYDAEMRILSGGSAVNTELIGGNIHISGGAFMSGGLMRGNPENKIHVAQRAYLTDFKISAGSVYVAEGGEAYDIEIGKECAMTVQGVGSAVTVSSGGSLQAEVGFGVLSKVFVENGGNLQNLQCRGGAVSAYIERVEGDTFHGLVDGLGFTGSAQVGSNALVRQLTLMENAQMSAFDGANISGATIEKGGVMTLTRDAVVQDLDVKNGGMVILSSGATVTDAALENGAVISAGATTQLKDITVSAGATLNISGYEAVLSGDITLLSDGNNSGLLVVEGDINVADAVISIDLSNRDAIPDLMGDYVCQISNFNAIAEAVIAVNIADNQAEGAYLLGAQGINFGGTLTISAGVNEIGALSFANDLVVGDFAFTLSTDDFGRLYLNVDVLPEANLTGGDSSQIIVWSKANGTVGYIEDTSFQNVYEWSEAETSMWEVAGAGRFAGAPSANDGILIYNNMTNTFAVWTDMNDPDGSYTKLYRMDSDCRVAGLANLDGNGYDDVLIVNANGSSGILKDGVEWQALSFDGELIGAGDFGAADDKDSLLVKNGTDYALWHNDNGSWTETAIGTSDLQVVGIGDFQGDGIDDIILWNDATGEVIAWEDGDSTNVRTAGTADANFWEIAAVGDYNGDNKADLLLRETVSGQGRLAYWGAGSEVNWTDMKCQVGNDKFAVIA